MKEPSRGCPFHRFHHIKEFDALDPLTRQDPLPFYDWLRNDESRKVYKLPHETDFYVVHRYDDVKKIFADSENYSNKIIPVAKSPFIALMDGDDHERIRSVISRIFTQKNIAAWEPEIIEIINTATGNLFGQPSVELFDKWANMIPLRILAVLFGLDASDVAIKKLHDDAIAINRALFVNGGTGPRRSSSPNATEKFRISWALLKSSGKLLRLWKLIGKKGMKELGSMMQVQRKDLNVPRPDFKFIPDAIEPMLDLMIAFSEKLSLPQQTKQTSSIETFKNAISPGEASLVEMIMAGAFILFAGYETTSSLLSNCFAHLSRDKKLFLDLKNHPEKIDDFIEESLRYYTPVGRFLRRTNKAMKIGETEIPKDAVVIILPGAANTDPDKFESGCGFNIDRVNNKQHLSFGKGIHFCPGAPLARMQVTYALKSLLNRANSISIDENYPLTMVTDRDNGILRYENLYITVK